MKQESHVVTISRFLIEEERKFPDATGAFTNLLSDIALAAKVIGREVNKAGLVDIFGAVGEENVHGEDQQKLDVFANQVMYRALDHTGLVACLASEESEEFIRIPDKFPAGDYVVIYDPLDGSSNIDVNVSIGTIFSIHRKRTTGERGTLEDCLQPGSEQVAAGYVLYGSSTMLVYTAGTGVHGFTLDPSIGEFILSHPNMRMPEPPKKVYSVNEAYFTRWSRGQQRLVSHLKNEGGFGSRYIGSMVADIHRTLLQGGLFMYPSEVAKPEGKLRLLYEAAPMAFILEQAGGRASTGTQEVRDIVPTSLHQRVPIYAGSREFVDMAEEMLAQDA
ncbi:MAG: class 1 fructose-bisphosphatase [Gemmatimonadota bacterium]|nr:class 1 fructose-bisphosphatase [Gemmatimonadota bacterium]MDE3007336.1 class 1 fructose-bisphosphatase [Gemmatimonadota bacterium]MDE3015240.1 class 1 fructose-bisphosphatase [Gemmatimonadota bacterium]